MKLLRRPVAMGGFRGGAISDDFVSPKFTVPGKKHFLNIK